MTASIFGSKGVVDIEDDAKFNFIHWLILGFIVAIILTLMVDVNICQYDACRYITVSPADIYISGDEGTFQSTMLMHYLYNNNEFPVAPSFIGSFIINALITTVMLPLLGVSNPIFRSPLAFSFFVLPGKEFFIILAIAFFIKAHYLTRKEKYFSSILMCTFAVIITLSVRPGYLLLAGMAMFLNALLIKKKYSQIFFLSGVFFSSAILIADYVDMSLPRGGFDEESSIQSVNFIREYTAGIFPFQTFIRFLIYLFYLLMLPLFEFYRFTNEVYKIGLMPYHVFLFGASIEWLLCVKKFPQNRLFFFYAVFSSLLVAISFAFVHTRYLLPLYLLFITINNDALISQPIDCITLEY